MKLKNASPAPALFAVYPQVRISDWSNEAAAEKTETIPVRPTKVVALRKPSPEKRNPVELTPPAPRPPTPSRPPLPRQWARTRSNRNGVCWPSSTRQGSHPNWLRSAARPGIARRRSAAQCRASSTYILFEDDALSNLDQARVASRSTETTRAALIKAATSVFAEYGYDGGSVRLITQRAMANQAAVNYHFGGKDGLYREVLIAATQGPRAESFSGPEELDALSPEEALRRYLHQFLLPLVKRDRVSRFLRIFAWESVQPSEVVQRLHRGVAAAHLSFGGARRTRFLPKRRPRKPSLSQRCGSRINRCSSCETRSGWRSRPFALKFDEVALERLVDTLASFSLRGLAGVFTLFLTNRSPTISRARLQGNKRQLCCIAIISPQS